MQECPYRTPDTCSQAARNATANVNAAPICNPNYPGSQSLTSSGLLSANTGHLVADVVSSDGVLADAVSPVQLDNPSNEKASAQGSRIRRISP